MNIIETNFNWNGALRHGNVPKTAVLHHVDASNCTVEDIHRWHVSRSWTGIGYHYFVTKEGKVYKGRPDTAFGAHCLHNNTNTLGISAEGAYMTETMPKVQRLAIIELLKYLMAKYNFANIRSHGELNPSQCPGKNYPFKTIKFEALAKPVVKPIAVSYKNKIGVVTANVLNVRSGASTRYRIIGKLEKGAKVKIASKRGAWFHIYFGNHGGWISARYLKL